MAKRFAKFLSLLTPKRSWAQFSLGTMLVAVTVFCLSLGDYVNPIRRLERKLRDPNAKTRADAAESLGRMGDQARSAKKSLLASMGDGSEDVRSNAAWAFSRVGGRSELLLSFLADAKHQVRLAAAESILWAGGDPATVVPTLLDVSDAGERSSSSERDVSDLLSALGPDQSAAVVPALLDALAANVDTSTPYALKCVSVPAPTVVPDLIDRLGHEQPEVRIAAAEQLLRLGSAASEAAPHLRKRLQDRDAKAAAAMVAALGAVAPDDGEFLPILAQSLRADDADFRLRVVSYLKVLGPIAAGASDALVAALRDLPSHLSTMDPYAAYFTSAKFMQEVSAALERMGPAALRALERALERAPDAPTLLHVGVPILVRFGKGRALRALLPSLVTSLDNKDDRARQGAIFLLGRVGKDAAPAAPHLAKLLDSDDENERVSTFLALKRIGVLDETARARLKAAQSDSLADDRLLAANALFASGEPADQLLSTLVESATSENESDSFWAFAGLKAMGAAAAPAAGAMAKLLARSESFSYDHRPENVLVAIGAAAVPELTRALQDQDPSVRNLAAETLGEIGPAAKDSIPLLVDLLDDKQAWRSSSADIDLQREVRGSAVVALGRIGSEAQIAVPKFVLLLEEQVELRRRGKCGYSGIDMLIRALGRIGPRAREAVPAMVRSVDWHDRHATVSLVVALSKIDRDNPSLVPYLKRMLARLERESQTDVWDEDEPEGVAETVWELGSRAAALVPELRRMVFTNRLYSAKGRCYAAFALARFASQRQEAVQYLERTAAAAHLDNGYFVDRDFVLKLLQRINDAPLDSASD